MKDDPLATGIAVRIRLGFVVLHLRRRRGAVTRQVQYLLVPGRDRRTARGQCILREEALAPVRRRLKLQLQRSQCILDLLRVIRLFLRGPVDTAAVVVDLTDADRIFPRLAVELLTVLLEGVDIEVVVRIAVNRRHRHDILDVRVLVHLLTIGVIEGDIDIFKVRDVPGRGIIRILPAGGRIILTHDTARAHAETLREVQRRHARLIVNLREILVIRGHQLLVHLTGVAVDGVAGICAVAVEVRQVQLIRRRLELRRAFTVHEVRKRGAQPSEIEAVRLRQLAEGGQCFFLDDRLVLRSRRLRRCSAIVLRRDRHNKTGSQQNCRGCRLFFIHM